MNLLQATEPLETTAEGDRHAPERIATPGLHHGRILSVQYGRYFVLCADTAVHAHAAASCLLQPQTGDHVLVSVVGTESYVLAVLERANPQRAVLQLEGDVALRLPSGALQVQAAEGMSLDAGPALKLQADAAAFEMEQLSIHAGQLMTRSQQMHTHAEQRVDVATYRHDIATRMQADYGDSVRRVAGHDEQSARSSRIVIEREWRVRSERSDILSRKRVKIDAAQVDLG